MNFDFENIVPDMPVEPVEYSDILALDSEATLTGESMILPFALDMVSDSDRETLASAMAGALQIDTEGLIDTTKKIAADFWVWLKKIWAKFTNIVADLYKKIKALLGFKEKEIDEAIKDYNKCSDTDKLVIDAEYASEVAGTLKDKELVKKTDELVVEIDAIVGKEDVDDAELSKSEKSLLEIKKELENRMTTIVKDAKFVISPDMFVTFKNGIQLPDSKVLSSITNLLKIPRFEKILGVVTAKVTISDGGGVSGKIIYLVENNDTKELTQKIYDVRSNDKIAVVDSKDTLNGLPVNYLDNLNAAKEVITKADLNIKEGEEIISTTDELIKEHEGSEKAEDKIVVKTSQTLSKVAKQQSADSASKVSKTIIVKNKRTKNKKYKHKKKS